MSARLALVVSKRTPYIMLTTECCAGNGIGGAFLTCEHAARTCSTVAMEVCGPNWTTIDCLSRAWSIFEQPVRARKATAAAAATIRARTPPLYDEPASCSLRVTLRAGPGFARPGGAPTAAHKRRL